MVEIASFSPNLKFSEQSLKEHNENLCFLMVLGDLREKVIQPPKGVVIHRLRTTALYEEHF